MLLLSSNNYSTFAVYGIREAVKSILFYLMGYLRVSHKHGEDRKEFVGLCWRCQ